MELKKAVMRAASVADSKSQVHSRVLAQDGYLIAFDGTLGVRLRCEDLDGLDPFMVDAKQWAAQVAALRGTLTLTLGPKMVTTAGLSAKFRIQWTPKRAVGPAVPKRGWTTISAKVLRGLAALTPLVSSAPLGEWASTGVCLDPEWAGAASGERAGVLRVPGLVTTRVVVRPDFLLGLSGDSELLALRRAVWLRCGDEARWTVPMGGEWPDEAIMHALGTARSGHCHATAPVSECQRAAAQVLVVAQTETQPVRLTTGDGVLCLHARGDHSDVETQSAATLVGAVDDTIGCSGRYIKLCVDAIAQLGAVEVKVVMGQPLSPITFYSTSDPVLETLIMPRVL